MNKLEIAKKIVKENFKYGNGGLYNTRNVFEDITQTIYGHDDLRIDICRDNEYFEIFGLSYEEFEELSKFYVGLQKPNMVLVTPFATYDNIKIRIDNYKADNSICVSLWNQSEGSIAFLTTCLNQKGKLKDNESYLDTNNCPWAIGFIEKYNLGEVSEFRCGYSGYCTYPVVVWNIDELKKYE